MDVQLIRRAVPFVYLIAILLAVFFGNGTSVAAVAVIGAVIVGAMYALTAGRPGVGRERNRNRNR